MGNLENVNNNYPRYNVTHELYNSGYLFGSFYISVIDWYGLNKLHEIPYASNSHVLIIFSTKSILTHSRKIKRSCYVFL